MIEQLHEDWQKILQSETEKSYFKKLADFVDSERDLYPESIFPRQEEVFNALNSCLPHEVKVVILGQDPYPTVGHAHGLSFSVSETVKPLPRSLNNIYKELQADLGIEPASNGDLKRWAKQGVLLLNAVLTVREGLPNSHAKKGWEMFTDKIIELLNRENKHVVYLLWGRNAHLKAKNVDAENNLIIRTSHPSPLGYTKSGNEFESFRGSKQFSMANAYLAEHGEKPVQW